MTGVISREMVFWWGLSLLIGEANGVLGLFFYRG